MPFLPGNNANPNGRPRKAPDLRSEMMQEFCEKNRENIEKVGDIVLEKALKEEAPWAIKLAAEMFYPKAGTHTPVEKTTTHNRLNVQISPMLKDLSAADQSSLWEIISKAQQRKPVLVEVSKEVK